MGDQKAPSETPKTFSINDIKKILRPAKPLWIRCVIEPLAVPVGLLLARTTTTPLQITIGSIILTIAAGWLFFTGNYTLMLVGSLLHQLVIGGDYTDGMIARLKKSGSIFAMSLDYFSDNMRLFICVMGLAYGQYLIENDLEILLWGFGFVFISEAEFVIPRMMIKIHQAYEEYYPPSLKPMDYWFLKLERRLAKYKLKVIFFNVHERETLVLLFGPLLGKVKLMLIISTVLAFIFYWIRIYFDTVLIRNELLNREKQYLGHKANVFGELNEKGTVL